MRATRIIFAALTLALCAAAAQAQDTTTITYTFNDANGRPYASKEVVTVFEVVKPGQVIPREPLRFRTSSSGQLLNIDGTVGMKLARNSVARMYIDAPGFSDTNSGVWYVIPDAPSASLATLQRWVTGVYYITNTTGDGFTLNAPSLTTGNAQTTVIPNSGFTGNVYTVKQQNGTVVFNIDADGNMTVGNAGQNINALTEDTSPDGAADFAMTYDASCACHKKVLLNNLPGGGGGGGASNLDGLSDVVITGPVAAQYVRYNGGNWVNGAIAAGDLPTAIDAAKIGNGSVSNSEFAFLDGVTSAIQAQINNRLTQAAADALYSVIGHNHSGVYEPANANIQNHIASTSNPHSVTKAQVGLGNVDNLQQQPINPILTDLAGLTQASNKGVYFDSATTAATFDLTAYGRSIAGVADEAAFKALVNLEPGVDVQAHSANLDAWAALATSAKANASHTHGLADITDEGALASLNTVGTSQIDNDAVNFAKMQNILTDKLIGRDTAASGDPEEIGLTGSLEFSGTQTIRLVGDSASPGNSKYYGTNGGGVKGFYDLPSGGGGGANTALSNLASVAISTTLLSDTDNTDDLGSSSLKWRNVYVGTQLFVPNINSITNPPLSIGSTNTGLYARTSTLITAVSSGADHFGWGAGVFRLSGDTMLQWSTASDPWAGGGLGLRHIGLNTLRISDDSGNTAANLILGTSSAAVGTGGIGVLVLENGTAPSSSPTGVIQVYSDGGEAKVRDAGGNTTTFSPHNFSLIGKPSEPMAWAFYSERDGMAINVDMLKLARWVEKLSGDKLVYIGKAKPTTD